MLYEVITKSIFLASARSAQIYVPGQVYHVHSASGLFYNRLKLAHVGMIGALMIAVIGAIHTVDVSDPGDPTVLDDRNLNA